MHDLDTAVMEVTLSGKQKHPRLKERPIKAKFWREEERKIANFHKLVCLPTPSVPT